MRLAAQMVKELLSYFRDPQQRIQLFGPPLIQLLVLSSAGTLEVSNVDIAVFNEDSGSASHEVIQRIAAAHFVHEVIVVERKSLVTQMIDQRKVLAGVHISPDFSRDVAAGRPTSFQVLIDGRRANAGQIVLSYLQTIAGDFGAQLAGESVGIPQPQVRHWFNQNLLYRWFFVPGMLGVLLLLSSLVPTATSIAKERELGTFDQLLVSPSTPLEIVIAKSIPSFVVGTLLGAMMIATSVWVFGIPFLGSFPLLMMCVMLYILSIVGVGLMLSSICANQQQAILGSFAIGIPADSDVRICDAVREHAAVVADRRASESAEALSDHHSGQFHESDAVGGHPCQRLAVGRHLVRHDVGRNRDRKAQAAVAASRRLHLD